MTHCPRCQKPLTAAKAINGGESTTFKECPSCGTLINTYVPTTYQAAFLRSRQRYKLTAGGYGCSPAGSKVLMYDGTIKNVEDVIVGDVLMGPDNKPRNVLKLHRGEAVMFNVKTSADDFIITEHHGFHVELWENNEAIYITAMTPRQIASMRIHNTQELHLRYANAIEFPEKEHTLSPYFLGMYLCGVPIQDPAIFAELRRLDCMDRKHIPEEYLTSSIAVREVLLSAIVNIKGKRFRDEYKIKLPFLKDIQRLARSLGLYTRIYKNTITISPKGPKHVPFKQVATKTEAYYGFELDEDHLYVDGETFLIHHNSGKSRANIEDVIKHLLLIPNARVVVAARTYPALDSTFVKEFYSIFPEKLVRRKNEQKREIVFTNGSELIFRSFDDPTKLKSMNITKAVIIEASDVPFSSFTMLQSRLRNTAAMIPKLDFYGNAVTAWDEFTQTHRTIYEWDARSINLETNPDSGWVKEFLLDSGTVEFYGDAYNEGYRFKDVRDDEKYSQVVSTSANPHLPPNYEREQTRGKSDAYIQQFYRGSFNFSTDLVFPNFGTCIVAPKKLPRAFDEEGKRVLYYVIGVDYGINDPTHVIFGAFSTETHKLYVYDELRVNNYDVATIAKEYRKAILLNGTDLDGLLMLPRFDGRSYNKRESDLRTIGDMFEDEGLYFAPSFASHEARIIKTNALINHGQLEVFSTCEFFIEEMLTYKFKLDRNGVATDKPIDGRDHGITAFEFVTVELPSNLYDLRLNVFIPPGTHFVHDKKKVAKQKPSVYNPFQEEETYGTSYLNNQYCPTSSVDHTYGIEAETFEDDRGDAPGDYYKAFRGG